MKNAKQNGAEVKMKCPPSNSLSSMTLILERSFRAKYCFSSTVG